MTTAIEIFHTNKRKFVSDLEGFSPSTRFCQVQLLSLLFEYDGRFIVTIVRCLKKVTQLEREFIFVFYLQEESSCNAKKAKASEPERLPTSTVQIEETDHMMIDENSNPKEIETTTKSPAMIIPKHCNGICEYVSFFN